MLFWIAVYIVGALSTAAFNLSRLVYIESPLSIVRNALLWPVCLPVLLILWIGEFD